MLLAFILSFCRTNGLYGFIYAVDCLYIEPLSSRMIKLNTFVFMSYIFIGYKKLIIN